MHTATSEALARQISDLLCNRVSPVRFEVSAMPEREFALATGTPVFIGISVGKLAQAQVYRIGDRIEDLGHARPRLLIHSDLGPAEWSQSPAQCERLAARLGADLLVARKQASDWMDRRPSR